MNSKRICIMQHVLWPKDVFSSSHRLQTLMKASFIAMESYTIHDWSSRHISSIRKSVKLGGIRQVPRVQTSLLIRSPLSTMFLNPVDVKCKVLVARMSQTVVLTVAEVV